MSLALAITKFYLGISGRVSFAKIKSRQEILEIRMMREFSLTEFLPLAFGKSTDVFIIESIGIRIYTMKGVWS